MTGVTGFQRKHVTLAWSDKHELHGLKVVMRRRPLGEMNAATLAELPGEGKPWVDLTPAEKVARSEYNAADLAGLIVEWNFTDDDGNHVPVTAEGVLRHCDLDMINDMWEAYNNSTVRVAPPLPKSSGDGLSEDWAPIQEPLTPS